MKFFILGLLLLSSMGWAPTSGLGSLRPLARASIAPSDPDFSIVLFPDTQYYHGNNTYVFQDQANWVVNNYAALNIKMVIGLGDMVDDGGYPVDSSGNVNGTCATVPPSAWHSQWRETQAAVNILTSHGREVGSQERTPRLQNCFRSPWS